MKQVEKLKTQTEIAEILGISKSQLSKLLSSKFHISPVKETGNKKFYNFKTVESVYRNYKDGNHNDREKVNRKVGKGLARDNSLLVSSLKEEVSFLRKQLETKQEIIDRKDEQIKESSKTVADLANKLAKLADQSQQLNLIDKPVVVSKKDKETINKMEMKQEKGNKETKRGHWWSHMFKK